MGMVTAPLIASRDSCAIDTFPTVGLGSFHANVSGQRRMEHRVAHQSWLVLVSARAAISGHHGASS